MEYSLFYPPNAEKRVQKLTAESINSRFVIKNYSY